MATNLTVEADVNGRRLSVLIDLPTWLIVEAERLADNDVAPRP